MPFQAINLRLKHDHVRRHFDRQVAAILISRTDLTHAQIALEFGIGEKVVRRVMKQFSIAARKRGPKPGTLKLSSRKLNSSKLEWNDNSQRENRSAA